MTLKNFQIMLATMASILTMLIKNIETYLRLLILMYADDTVLISDYAAKLQSSLYNLVDFCKLWNLNINKDKTKAMVTLFDSRKDGHFSLEIEGTELEIMSTYEYLGVIFSNTCSLFQAFFSVK